MEEMKNWADVRWQGYARKNGSKGIRNRILVIYTVKCSEFVSPDVPPEKRPSVISAQALSRCLDLTDVQTISTQLIC